MVCTYSSEYRLRRVTNSITVCEESLYPPFAWSFPRPPPFCHLSFVASSPVFVSKRPWEPSSQGVGVNSHPRLSPMIGMALTHAVRRGLATSVHAARTGGAETVEWRWVGGRGRRQRRPQSRADGSFWAGYVLGASYSCVNTDCKNESGQGNWAIIRLFIINRIHLFTLIICSSW